MWGDKRAPEGSGEQWREAHSHTYGWNWSCGQVSRRSVTLRSKTSIPHPSCCTGIPSVEAMSPTLPRPGSPQPHSRTDSSGAMQALPALIAQIW